VVPGRRVQRRAHHVLPGAIDAGLGVRALADAQRLLHQLVQQPTDALRLDGRLVCLAQLAEDLRLADHHRIETGGDPEGVVDRGLVVVDVEVRRQFAGGPTRVPGEHGAHIGETAVEP
jgi:hypothetical protein